MGQDHLLKLEDVKKIAYREQAIWFLNFFEAGNDSKKYEETWEIHKKCKENGSFISECKAFSILQEYGYSNTIQSMRKFIMPKFDHDDNSDSKIFVSLIEILMCKYNVGFKILQNAAAQEMIRCFHYYAQKEAQANILNQVKINVDLAMKISQEAVKDMEFVSKYEEIINKNTKDKSKISKECKDALNALSRVKECSEIAFNELNFHEIDYVVKKQKLKDKSNDMTLSITNRNKAKVKLDILSVEKPLSFQSAKICHEAVNRKLIMSEAFVRKKKCLVEELEKTIDQTKKMADDSKMKASKNMKKAEDFIQEAHAQLSKALDGAEEGSLTESYTKNTANAGTIFYLKREMKEVTIILKMNAQNALKMHLPLKIKSDSSVTPLT